MAANAVIRNTPSEGSGSGSSKIVMRATIGIMFHEQGGQAGGDERAAALKAHLEQNRFQPLSRGSTGHDQQLATTAAFVVTSPAANTRPVAAPNAAPPPDPARLTTTAAAAAPAETTSQSAMLVNEAWLPAPAPPGGRSKRSYSRSHIG